jgi:hypothetical protein
MRAFPAIFATKDRSMLAGQPDREQVSDRAQRRTRGPAQLFSLRREQSPAPLGLGQLAVHGDRALHRRPADRVGPDADPDLPDPRPAFPHGPCSATRHRCSVALL